VTGPDHIAGANVLGLRLQVTSNFGFSADARFNEVVFGGALSDGNVAPVPVPAALPLLGSGLTLVGFAGRRRKKIKA
jgi:hypothetical protein